MCPTLLANGNIYVKPNVENNTKNVENHFPFSASGSYVMPHLLNLFAGLVALLNQSLVHRCQDRTITMDKRDRPSSSIMSKYMNILYSKCQGTYEYDLYKCLNNTKNMKRIWRVSGTSFFEPQNGLLGIKLGTKKFHYEKQHQQQRTTIWFVSKRYPFYFLFKLASFCRCIGSC